jgi:hypothetical protein
VAAVLAWIMTQLIVPMKFDVGIVINMAISEGIFCLGILWFGFQN